MNRKILIPFLLALVVSLGGCATEVARITGVVSTPAQAGKHRVAVIADYSMSNEVNADALAKMVRLALQQQGYQVVSSEDSADLIVLPFFALLKPGQDISSQSFRAPAGSLLFGNNQLSGMLNTPGNGNFSSAFLDAAQAPMPEEAEGGLMVTAITRQDWSTLSDKTKDVPRVWRVTAAASIFPGQEGNLPSALVNTAAPYFGKNTGGKIHARLLMPQ